MKIPCDVSGPRLVRALRVLGYEFDRQDGSHIRLTTERDGQHHVTVPAHFPLKAGTLVSILKLIAAHHGMEVFQLMARLEL